MEAKNMDTPKSDIPKYELIKHKLSNDIDLILVPLQNTLAVTSIVLFGVGSRYESDQQRGLAHFTEHMVFKGGEKYESAQKIAQALDAVGGEFNAYTSQEFTGFYTKTASLSLDTGLDVLSDMVLRAKFPSDELAKEKGVIVEEINMYEDMPMRKVDQVLSELVFGDSPLGRPIIGTKDSVTAFTRDDFETYKSEFYVGNKCTIVLAGNIDLKNAKEKVEKYFGDMPAGQKYEATKVTIVEKPEGQRVKVEFKESEQTHLMLSVKSLPISHPDKYILRVLSIVLGGNMSSRLFTSVREQQGLCYYVRASSDSYIDEGILVASAGVDNNRLKQAIKAIIKELKLMSSEPISAEELNRAKQFALGRTLLALEDSENVAETFGMQNLMEGELTNLPDMAAGLNSVTAEQVQVMAQKLFTDQYLRLAIIGPHKDSEALEKLLTFK